MVLYLSAGRDPRAMDARGPVTGQRVPMAGAMPGPIPHSMGPNPVPPARPVTTASNVSVFLFLTVNYQRTLPLCFKTGYYIQKAINDRIVP